MKSTFDMLVITGYRVTPQVLRKHLMNCCEIWGNTYATNIQCIILIQKRVIRLIHGANRWDHTNNLFYEYRILKFNDIVELRTILFMFDACHNVLPYDLQQLFINLFHYILHVEHINSSEKMSA